MSTPKKFNATANKLEKNSVYPPLCWAFKLDKQDLATNYNRSLAKLL